MSRTVPAGRLDTVSDQPPGPAADPSPAGAAAQLDEGPTPLRVAVLVLWAEAALLAGVGVFGLVRWLTGRATTIDVALWVVFGSWVVAVALWYSARLLIRRRIAGRGLAIVCQLLSAPVAYAMALGAGSLPVRAGGVLIALAAVSCVVLLIVPSSRRALGAR